VATLSDLRTQAQYLADAVNDSHKSTAEWTVWANYHGAELWDELANLFEDRYTTSTSGLTVSSGVLSFTLSTAMRVRAIEKSVDGGQNWMRVEQTPLREFSRWRTTRVRSGSPYADVADCTYAIVGTQILITPSNATSGTFRVWYVPVYTAMSSDSDSLFGGAAVPNQWHEFVAIGMAIDALGKEESDPSFLMARKAALLARIRKAASNRSPGGSRMRETATHRDEDF